MKAYAATPAPTASTNSDKTASSSSNASSSANIGKKLEDQLNEIKERIASRVAQLNLVEKRAVIGNVQSTTTSQITLTDLQGNTRYVDVDEITKFSSPSAKGSFGISDLTKGTKVRVLGLYNKQTQRIQARFVDVITEPTRLVGEIASLDKTNFTLTLTTEDNKQKNIDIENFTKISKYTKDGGIAKYGFSKLQLGDLLFVIGFPDKKDSTLLVADRILVIGDVAKDPKISVTVPTPTEIPVENTPSSISGKKTNQGSPTPTTKTPSPTAKASVPTK